MRAFWIALLSLAATAPASAELLHSNGHHDPDSALARQIALFRVADDFVLESAADVTSIRFWMATPEGAFGGTLTYAVYASSESSLGDLLDTATATDVVPVFSNDIPGFAIAHYQVDFDLPAPLSLDAGTYWLELHDGPALTTSSEVAVYWAVVAGDPPGNARQNLVPELPSNDVGDELAFELYGTLPEPGAAVAAWTALATLVSVRRSRR